MYVHIYTHVVGPPRAYGRGVFVVFCRFVFVFTAFRLFLAVPMVRFGSFILCIFLFFNHSACRFKVIGGGIITSFRVSFT